MMRSILIGACLLMGTNAIAKANLTSAMRSMNHQVLAHRLNPHISMNVGDTDNYTMTMDGMSGTMVVSITAADMPTSITMQSVISIMGQTETEVDVIDPTTGNIISITVNGQPQTPPAAGDITVTGSTLDSATVPAGTFNCQDITIHQTSTDEDSEEWIDTDDIPAGGMVKMTTTINEEGMSIPVEADLSSFTFGSASSVRH